MTISAELRRILGVALVLRLVTAWFSEGYLMHDDHFLVVEAAASWAEGKDYNNWFPWSQEAAGLSPVQPHPANFAYVGTQFFVIKALRSAGLDDPKSIAFALRILHAFYSLLVVFFSYRIAFKVGGSKAASWTGWVLAAWAVLPVLSVHQLVEMACIPPLLLAFDRWLAGDRRYWLIGLGFGVATAIRFQCGLVAVGWAVGVLAKNRADVKSLKDVAGVGVLSLVFFSLGQIQDLFIWGKPFVQLQAYFGYNTTHALNYPQGPPGQYLLTLLGLMIPPLSLAILWGFFRETRKWPEVAVAVLAFWLFHEIYPNKQERFILPVLPLIAALGLSGWWHFVAISRFWNARPRLHRSGLVVFWTLNTVVLVALSVGRFKSSRTDAMYALYEAGNLSNFMAIYVDSSAQPPTFYSGSWEKYYVSRGDEDPEQRLDLVCKLQETRPFPNYLLFYGDAHLGEVIARYKESWPDMTYVRQIPPGRFDQLIHWLNPLNSVERVMIYRVDPTAACTDVN